jgi:3-methyladenine DNA glycosylase AlkD
MKKNAPRADAAARALADELEASLRASGTPERAAQEKRYLKSDLEHLGVTVPAVRAAAKRFLAEHPDLDRPALVALVEALWASPIHERRAVAVELCDLRGRLLAPDDLPLCQRLVRESKTWALVDNLAAHVVGGLVVRHPALAGELDGWARDDDFWVRRAAMLALLLPLREGGGDFERFGRYADAMLGEREFFIAKAIGWILRDTSRKRPALVRDWLAPRAARATATTVREAVRYLDEADRAAILAAHRVGRAKKRAAPGTLPKRAER